mmetsp:Transcript_13153/g.33895  ORF Transcript_13153/g.33895 Transcript_13153/m.33895 type:complete len:336 (-) Transcript_13153:1406-2413(-)
MIAFTPRARASASASSCPPHSAGSLSLVQYPLKPPSTKGANSMRFSSRNATHFDRYFRCEEPPSPSSWSEKARNRHAPSASTFLHQRPHWRSRSSSWRKARSQPPATPDVAAQPVVASPEGGELLTAGASSSFSSSSCSCSASSSTSGSCSSSFSSSASVGDAGAAAGAATGDVASAFAGNVAASVASGAFARDADSSSTAAAPGLSASAAPQRESGLFPSPVAVLDEAAVAGWVPAPAESLLLVGWEAPISSGLPPAAPLSMRLLSAALLLLSTGLGRIPPRPSLQFRMRPLPRPRPVAAEGLAAGEGACAAASPSPLLRCCRSSCIRSSAPSR